ncbi:MAG: diacylglycerol/polyprenol kinase family protein [Spirochaetales bacterium]
MVAVSITFASRSDEIRTEVLRKSIHLMIGMTPLLANLNLLATMGLLSAGIVVYSWAESLRLQGKSLGFVTSVTRLASRKRDHNKAVMGPITLGLGALLCLMLYPEPAATVGIYALAFGDGLSSLVGKLFGRIKLPFTGGKTLEGSLTAFLAIFVAAYLAKPDVRIALTVAVCGTALEALPLEDLDNLVIPLGTALVFATLVPV